MNRRVWAFALLGMLAVLTVGGGVVAASTDGFDLGWHVVAGGGGQASAEGLQVEGTAGQAAAGLLKGGDYELGSGFWGGGELVKAYYGLHLPIVVRSR